MLSNWLIFDAFIGLLGIRIAGPYRDFAKTSVIRVLM